MFVCWWLEFGWLSLPISCLPPFLFLPFFSLLFPFSSAPSSSVFSFIAVQLDRLLQLCLSFTTSHLWYVFLFCSLVTLTAFVPKMACIFFPTSRGLFAPISTWPCTWTIACLLPAWSINKTCTGQPARYPSRSNLLFSLFNNVLNAILPSTTFPSPNRVRLIFNRLSALIPSIDLTTCNKTTASTWTHM